MSTLRANNLTRQSGSGAPDLGGVAANRLLPSAWVNFNGVGVVAIRDAYNVASITDNGIALYTVNFAVAMANANYVWAGIARSIDASGGTINSRLADIKTVNACQLTTASGSAYADSSEVLVMFLGGF